LEDIMSQRDVEFRDYERMQTRDESRQQNQGIQGGQRQEQGLTTRRESWTDQEQGRWKGYVVPYRYYGPGFRGVGYYSVFYQGPDTSEGETETTFDQRGVRYGQGQGAGSAWVDQDLGATRGGFAGRGPKGYQRSDERIREDISDQLMANDWLDASDIEVTVKNGDVTLTGTVDNRTAKRLAEDIAEHAAGVQDVMNQIRVQSSRSSSTRSRQGSTSMPGSPDDTSATRSGQETHANGRRKTATSTR